MSDFLSSLITPALIGLLITASFLVVVNDWRWGFAALAAQYLLAAVLIAQIAVWQVVVVKILAGLLSVGILYLTGAEVRFGRKAEPPLPEGLAPPPPAAARFSAPFEFPTGLPFRVMAVLMVGIAAWNIATQSNFVLKGVPPWLNLAGYLLIALSLLNLGLTEEPMNAGLGLLTLLTGFGIFYTAVEPSLAIVALLAAVDFVIALAVGYLAFLHYTAAEKEPAH